MEPLFSAVICGCNAGLFREVLHGVYIPRIQRGNACFAAKVLGATAPLLTVLVHFFEGGRWGSLVGMAVEGQSLTAEDQLFILIQAGQYLTATRGFAPAEVRVCYERAESLCLLLNRPLSLYVAMMGRWRHSNITEKLTAALQIAERIYSLAREHNEVAELIGAVTALAITNYFLGNLEAGRQYAMRGVQLWRSPGAKSPVEDLDVAAVSILCYQAQFDSHIGEIASARTTMAEAISLAKALNDAHGLAVALSFAAGLAHLESNLVEVERCSSDLIELSTRHHFAYWIAIGAIFRGWVRSASGNSAEGIPSIDQGIRDLRATGVVLSVPFWLGLKAEALYFADRTSEALAVVKEAEVLAERFENRIYYSGLHRLLGVLLAAIAADEIQIEASFGEAIRIAWEQKSVLLEKRAEATYAEYCRQKASGSARREFRLPLC